jgi:opacity protein-like surface antigen
MKSNNFFNKTHNNMKQLSAIALGLLIHFSTSYSQDSKIAVGVELSPTTCSLRGNAFVDNHDSRLGFSTGLSIDYFLTSQFSIKSGLAFERKGSKIDMYMLDGSGNEMGTQEAKFNYDYLTLPILASYSTKGKTKFYIDAGPYLSFLLGQKTTYEAVGSIPERTEDGSESTKKIDLGLSVGAGLYIPLGDNLILDLGLRDNLGLINVSSVSIFDDGSIKTNSLGLKIGLKYKF